MTATYGDVVLELDTARRVEVNLFQGLSDDIVWLALALLGSFNGSSLVNVALVVNVELAESVAQAVDFVLGELRILPVGRCASVMANPLGDESRGAGVCNAHLWSLRTFMMADV